MKVLVFAHELHVGGTQVNAIELTAELRDRHGCDVVLFAAPGVMVRLVEEKRLRFVPSPLTPMARMQALREVVRTERPDMIHVWDWPQCLHSFYSVHLPMRLPMMVTVMSMCVPRLLPKALPTTFGTPELVDQARAAGRRRSKLILPPVDVHQNAPDAVDPRLFREQWGIKKDDIAMVSVSRLVEWMKAESLRRTIEVVRKLGRELPLRFIIVGDGTSRPQLEQLAGEVNAELGRPAIVLTGSLLDPRPAYAAADIVVGMGGSGLRGMAFGKPVLIVGENGFSAPFNPQTAESFYFKGIWGVGDGDPENKQLLADIRGLAENPGQLAALGEFSRQFVVKHFSVETVGSSLAEFCRDTVEEVPGFHVSAADGLRTAALMVGRKLVPASLRSRPGSAT